MNLGPVFIGGLDRSGKTLLRLALSLHPNIIITKRTDLWTYFYNRYGDLREADNFERCLSAILAYKHVRFLQPDVDRIRREFLKGEPTYARLFAIFYTHYAEREGKLRWGDQSELVERYADPIFRAYPGARIIQLIRDPRDRYGASKTRWQIGKGRVGAATARWLYSTRLAVRNLHRYPGKYKVVQYETLVSHPEETISEICGFLGEEYFPEMLRIAHTPHQGDEIIRPENGETSSHFLTDFIGDYYLKLTKGEIAFIQKFSYKGMLTFGYSQQKIGFSPVEWITYWLKEWPDSFMRMLLWRANETVQQAFPAQFGDMPSNAKKKRVSSLESVEKMIGK